MCYTHSTVWESRCCESSACLRGRGKGEERLQQPLEKGEGVNICGATYISHLFCLLGKVQLVSGLRIERRRQHTTPPINARNVTFRHADRRYDVCRTWTKREKLVELLRPCTIIVKYGGERDTFANFPNAKKGRKFRSIFWNIVTRFHIFLREKTFGLKAGRREGALKTEKRIFGFPSVFTRKFDTTAALRPNLWEIRWYPSRKIPWSVYFPLLSW